MNKVIAMTALLGLSSGAFAAPRISAQSIIVNPVETGPQVKVWVNRDPNGGGNPVYRKGEAIRVGVRTSQDAYVYLFNVNADGQIDLFFPNGYEAGENGRSNFVKANTNRVFPGAGADYSLSVGGPNGQDKLLALASTRELNIDDIARFAGEQGFAQVRLQGQDNLARALSVIVTPLPGDAWGTDVALFRVGNTGNGGAGNGNAGGTTSTGTITETPNTVTPAPTTPAQPTQPTPTPTPQPTARIQPGQRQDGTFDQAMVEAYSRLQGEKSLGNATTYAVPWGDGWWQKFAGVGAYGQAILLHANGSSRSYAVHGRLLERYLALANAENGATRPPSRLGWAAGDEKVIPRNPYGTTGLYGFFQNGALYGTEKYGTFWLQGAVLKTYQGLGGSGSFLGFPTRDQYQIGGAWAADFEGGTVRTVNGVPKVYRK